MRNLIALDIDGVLLPWDLHEQECVRRGIPYDSERKCTGWSDWRHIKDTIYMSHLSAQMWKAIQDLGDVYWLTTWINGWGPKTLAEELMEPELGVKNLPTITPLHRFKAEDHFAWWKPGWLLQWIIENPETVKQYDRVIWIDDEINPDALYCWGIRQELEPLGVELRTIVPSPVLTLADIEACYELG